MSDHPEVRPGSLWASGTIFRVVELRPPYHVVVEEVWSLQDPPGSGPCHTVHTDWLDGGMFGGRLLRRAQED